MRKQYRSAWRPPSGILVNASKRATVAQLLAAPDILETRRMPGLWAKATRTALFVSVGAVITIALVYALLARAMNDDYCRAIWDGTPFGLAQQGYADWTGRWLAMTIHGAVLPRLDLHGSPYAATALCWLTLVYAIAFMLVSALMRAPLRTRLGLALIVSVAFWGGAPALGEQVYWFTGAVENLLSLALGLGSLLIVAARREGTEAPWINTFRLAAGAVLGVMTCGLHELVGALLLGAFILLLVHEARMRRWRRFGELVAVTCVIAAGLAFNVLAPGNAARLGRIPGRFDLLHAIRATLLDPETSPSSWLFDARLWALVGVALTSDWWAKAAAQWTDTPVLGFRQPIAKAAAVAGVGVAASYAAVFVASYLLGATTPGRVLDVCYAVLFGSGLFALVMLAPLVKPNPPLNAFAMGCLALALLTAPNTMKGLADLRLLAFEWRPALERRDELARQAAMTTPTREVLLPTIWHGPRLYPWFPLAVSDDAWNAWQNRCYARYMGLHAVRSMPAEPDASE